MERLLSVPQLMDRWDCSRQTVVRRLQEMRHMERPWYGYESAVEEWERSKTVRPAAEVRAEMMRAKLRRRMA